MKIKREAFVKNEPDDFIDDEDIEIEHTPIHRQYIMMIKKYDWYFIRSTFFYVYIIFFKCSLDKIKNILIKLIFKYLPIE